jgi:hypothetical protein
MVGIYARCCTLRRAKNTPHSFICVKFVYISTLITRNGSWDICYKSRVVNLERGDTVQFPGLPHIYFLFTVQLRIFHVCRSKNLCNRYLSFYWKKWFYIWYMAFAWWIVLCLPCVNGRTDGRTRWLQYSPELQIKKKSCQTLGPASKRVLPDLSTFCQTCFFFRNFLIFHFQYSMIILIRGIIKSY